MAEGGEGVKVSESEAHIGLAKVKPERVALIKDTSIVENKHIPLVYEIAN